MIDVYRFVLALGVLQAHVLAYGPQWLAPQAVFSFFVLSGFLMTLILNESYGFGWEGFFRFAANRALRLLPAYYIVIGLTALYLVFVGPMESFTGAIILPRGPIDWINNLVLVSPGAGYRLAPTAWSLAVECFCYALLGLYFARSRRRLLLMLVIGAAITLVQIVGGFGEPEYGFRGHYRVLQAGLTPFALGGLAYFTREARLLVYSHVKFAILCGLLVANVVAGYWSEFHAFVSGLYICMVLNFALVPMLFGRSATHGWQRALGGIAYPFFLSHRAIGMLIPVYVPAIVDGSFSNAMATALVSIAFSLVMYYGVDRQVQRFRSSIKYRSFRYYFCSVAEQKLASAI